jgi:hypothetical protein
MWIIFGSIAAVMGACYIQHINEWLIVPANLLRTVGKSDAIARGKLIMIIRFGKSFTRLVFWAAVFVLRKIVVGLWPSITILGEEIVYFAFTCVDLYFFWIRPGHRGTNEEAETVDETAEVALIDEPGHTVPLLCIVTAVGREDGEEV